jgi:cell division septal protein FtsQ
MSAVKRNKRGNSMGGGGIIFGSGSFAVICAALAFGMSVFFKVSNIEVIGEGKYSTGEIIEASGIKNGDNLMFINRQGVQNKIYSELIYICEAEVKRKLPNTVSIEVLESGSTAAVKCDSGYWLIDHKVRLLERSTAVQCADYIQVKGVTITEPELGKTISTSEEEAPKIAYLRDVLSLMKEKDMLEDITILDLSNIANAQMDYAGRFKVKLGKNRNLEQKLELMLGAVAKLSPEEEGIIDVSEEKKANFSPS